MSYLLDTNAVIAALKGHASLLRRLRQHSPQDFAMSAITAHELYFGAYKGSRTAQSLARIDALQFAVLEFDREDSRVAAELRAMLVSAGAPIGP